MELVDSGIVGGGDVKAVWSFLESIRAGVPLFIWVESRSMACTTPIASSVDKQCETSTGPSALGRPHSLMRHVPKCSNHPDIAKAVLLSLIIASMSHVVVPTF